MGASSFSKCLGGLKVDLCNELKLLTRSQVGEALAAYVNQVGLNEQFLDEANFKTVCTAMYRDGSTTPNVKPSQECVQFLYTEMLLGSRYNKGGYGSGGGIPALQALAVLFMFADPVNDSMDDKLEALLSICQFKCIPSERGDSFNHVTPNAMCSKAEFFLVAESVALGTTRLCCSNGSDAIDFAIVAEIANDIFRSSFTGLISVAELRHNVTEHPKVSAFLQSFTNDVFNFIPLLPLRQMSLSILARRQCRFMQEANPEWQDFATATAPVKSKGHRVSTRIKPALSALDDQNMAKTEVAVMIEVLNWRKCLNIIVDGQLDVGLEKCSPYDEVEIETLESILIKWGGDDGNISLKIFKMLNLVFLSFKLVLLHSAHKESQSLLPSSLSCLQRLYSLSCEKIGLESPDHVTHNDHIAAALTRSHGSHVFDVGQGDLYDFLRFTVGHDENGNPIPRKLVLSRLNWCVWCCEWLSRNETEKNTDEDIVEYFSQYATSTSASASGYVHDPLIVYDFLCEYLPKQSLILQKTNITAEILRQEGINKQANTSSSGEGDQDEGATEEDPIAVTILKDHIHFLADFIQVECTEHPYGLSVMKIKHVSKEIKKMVLQFVKYFKEVYGE